VRYYRTDPDVGRARAFRSENTGAAHATSMSAAHAASASADHASAAHAASASADHAASVSAELLTALGVDRCRASGNAERASELGVDRCRTSGFGTASVVADGSRVPNPVHGHRPIRTAAGPALLCAVG
jgi:hypothetical protein